MLLTAPPPLAKECSKFGVDLNLELFGTNRGTFSCDSDCEDSVHMLNISVQIDRAYEITFCIFGTCHPKPLQTTKYTE